MNKCYKHRLAEMKITEDLTMEQVYEVIDKKVPKEKKYKANLIIKINDKYNMNITYIDKISITFNINKYVFDIYIRPLKYKMYINDKDSINVDVVSVSQLNYLIKEYNFTEALIFCEQCNKFFIIEDENLIEHENHNSYIKERLLIKIIKKDSFNTFFKENYEFINKDIKPLEYEPNFKLYFKKSKIILKENNLHIFEDKYQNRMKLIDRIKIRNTSDNLIHFFGQPGKGKTLILIGALKYMNNHSTIGTLYINCKAFSSLETEIEIKQLIIDEIPFLFFGNYQEYSDCAKAIVNHSYNLNSSSFFELIDLVLNQIINSSNKKNAYIIVFDQYKDKYDKEGKKLEQLYDKLIKNKDEKIKDTTFCLLTFSSMNNKDIRRYKIQYIEDKILIKNDNDHLLYEIINLDYDLSIDDGGIYDQNLKNLGYGLKYYNILKYYHSIKAENKMEYFVNETKSHIRKNLLDFFGISEDLNDDESNFKIFTSFSTDVSYSKENILKVIKNIPFKYFDTMDDEDIEGYKIIFSFPLVGEVINKLYSDIINVNPSIYKNLTDNELDGGAKGKFFEKIVTYYLNINSSIYKENNNIEYFKDYPIKYHDEVKVLILNDNENSKSVFFKYNLIKKGIYLITQERYNGKALDIALIRVAGEDSEIIGIQISIKKKEIFTEKQVETILSQLKKNIYNYYDLKVKNDNLYFCYIFDYNNKDENMLQNCDKYGMKYLFFDVINKTFKDSKGRIINNLKNNLLRVIISDKDDKITSYFQSEPNIDNEELNKYILPGPIFKINENQKNSIIKLFKLNLAIKEELEIKYQSSLKYLEKNFVKNSNEFCISNYIIKEDDKDDELIVMITNLLKINKIKSDGQMFAKEGLLQSAYDYYIVVEKKHVKNK